MKLSELRNKEVLILGFGKEGRDSFQFLRRLFPNKVIGIADANTTLLSKSQKSIGKDKYIKWHLGSGYLKSLKDYDIIIKSPGVPIHLPEMESAFLQGRATSATEIFFENCQGAIIGITGTKGKGTTASLICGILKEGGKKAHLVGNIGRPPLSYLLRTGKRKEEEIFVYELSSHQLYGLKKPPRIAVILNVYPEHLDYYGSFREYVLAKANITRWQTKEDYLIFNGENQIVKEIAGKSKAKKIPFGSKNKKEPIFSKLKRPDCLRGEHNFLNILPAVIIGRLFEIPETKIIRAVENFRPLPHRLEFIGKRGGIKFYDDSAATTPQATLCAIEALGRGVQTIILGGSDKGADFRELAKKILQAKIKNVILFPTTGEKIRQELISSAGRSKPPKFFFVDSMEEAVRAAFERTDKGKTCLLSPASASFTLFKDYRHRGTLFKKHIRLNVKRQNSNSS